MGPSGGAEGRVLAQTGRVSGEGAVESGALKISVVRLVGER